MKCVYLQKYVLRYWKDNKKIFLSGLESVGIILIIAYIFYGDLRYAVILTPYIPFYVRKKLCEIKENKKKVLAKQFKDGIIAVSFSLHVGYSIENAFREALGELDLLYGSKSEITGYFKNINNRISMNENMEEILYDFGIKTGVEDILYFAEVFRYAKRSGGDLIGIIKNTANNISQKVETMDEIDTIISGKKMEQRIMSVVPIGMILYLKFTSGGFVESLYSGIGGNLIMTGCLSIYIFSCWMAKKIINIEV